MTDTIRDLELKLTKLRNEHSETLEVMKDLKTNHFQDIEAHSFESGLSNQKKRDIALEERLRDDGTYQQLLKQSKGCADSIMMLEIDLSFEQRQFKRWYVGKLLEAGGQ